MAAGWKTAIVVGAIGAIGSFGGGMAGTVYSHSLDEKEKLSDARGDARVLDEALLAADDAMKRSLIDDRYRFYRLTTGLPFADEKRLSTHLSPRQYDQVAKAESLVVLQQARSHELQQLGVDFSQYDRIQIWCDREALARARIALRSLSELPDKAAETDDARFHRTCERGKAGHHV